MPDLRNPLHDRHKVNAMTTLHSTVSEHVAGGSILQSAGADHAKHKLHPFTALLHQEDHQDK